MSSVIVLDSSDEDEIYYQNMCDLSKQLKEEMEETNKQFALKKMNMKRVENVHNINNNNNNNSKVVMLNNRVKLSGNESYAITENNTIKHTVANKAARYSALAKSNVNTNATAAYTTNNNIATNSTASITNYESNNKPNLATSKLKAVTSNNNNINVVPAKRPKLSNETTKLTTTTTTTPTKLMSTKPYSAQNLPPLQPSPQMKNQIRKITVVPVTTAALSTAVQKNSVTNLNAMKTIPLTMPMVLTNPPVSNFSTLDADMLPPLQLLATPPHQSSALSLETPQSLAATLTQNKKHMEANDCIILPAETANCKKNYTTKSKKTANSAKQEQLATCNKSLGHNKDAQNINNNIINTNSKPKIVHFEINGIVDNALTKPITTQLKKPQNDRLLTTPSIDLTQPNKISIVSNMKSSNQNFDNSKVAANQSKIQKQTFIETSSPKTTNTSTKPNLSAINCENIGAVDVTAESQLPATLVEEKTISENEPTAEYTDLLKVLRAADKSADMENLIEKKLNKYYSAVPYNFTKSRGFRKNMRAVKEAIHREPDLVYFHLKTVLEELKSRYRVKPAQEDDDEPEVIQVHSENENDITAAEANTEDACSNELKTVSRESPKIDNKMKQTNLQIQKLNAALHALTKKIEALEQAEVDWDEDDDSSYLQVERLKKRACQIYNKICDLTGENKNAHRLMKKPIKFNGTNYPQFNKTLRAYINRTREFPDYYDVLHMVEHCNNKYEFGLANFQIKRLAEDAFMQVGKLLQARRKTDLYETVSHYTANSADPAKNDPTLLAKLNDNKKVQKRIGDVIAKYAREQDRVSEELKSSRVKLSQPATICDKNKRFTSKIPNIDDEDEDSSDSSQDSSNDSEIIDYEPQLNNNEKKKTYVWSGVFSKKKLIPHEQETVDQAAVAQQSDKFVKNATAAYNVDNSLQNKLENTTTNGCDDLNKTQSFMPELKIVSVCSLKVNECNSSSVGDETTQANKTVETVAQNVSEIWISDDEDELKTGSSMKAT